MKKKIISLILCITMCAGILSVLSACDDDSSEEGGGGSSKTDAFVIMTENLDGLFNPFFATSGADSTIVSTTQIGMLTAGYENNQVVVAYGDNEAVVTKDFKSEYNSQNDTTTYTFVLKNGIKFSDGHALTMEDVLFNLYVYLDPVYTGSSTMYSTDIVGLAEYRTQNFGADSDTDNAINESARNMAMDRIYELVNLFTSVKDSSSKNEAGYNDMMAAIDSPSFSLSSGYIGAISNDPSKVTKQNLKDDYAQALKYFREELETDYDSAKDSYKEDPYKKTGEFDDITSFMYAEGFVTIEFGEKDGKPNADKSVITKVTRGYDPDQIKTKEAAIQYVYDSKIATELDAIIQYWATAGRLQTDYIAKAKEVLLHQNSEGGSLLIPNITGIVSLGHTSDKNTVTIGNNTYTVAHEHNSDGSPKNSGEYDVLEITIDGIDPKAVWNFSFAVAPQHYYAEGYTVDIEGNSFGVDFGSFEFMRDVIQSHRNVTVPMGAGAYMATNSANADNPTGTEFFNSNVVYFKANNNFLLGKPNIEKIRYQVVSATDALDALASGSVHYVSPQLTTENEERLDALKSKGFKSISVDQLGYGYIGINAGKIPNIYLRKAIMAAMDTSLAIQYYSPGTANRIFWPMSTVSWAYPKDEEGNLLPYNYGDYPAVQWTESSAIDTIRDYMSQASDHMGGYTDKDLEITFTIAGSNLTDHPTYLVFQTAAQILNKLGWDVEVIADTQALTKLSTGSLAVWAAAWGTTVDPDMYQVYHKDSTATSVYAWGYREILNNTGTYSIEYDILCDMSELIDEARETDIQADRAELYEEAMTYVLDLAVELPVYQRKVLYAYNTNIIDASSVPTDINPYSSPLDRIWELKFAE